MAEMNISRRKFLGVAGMAGALGAMALAGCSPSDETAEDTGTEEGGEEAVLVETEVVGFAVPVKEAADAVWKVDYVNDDLPEDFEMDNWRMSIDEFDPEKMDVIQEMGLNTDVSREGMDTLQTIGCADFTAKQFDWILSTVKEKADVDPEKLTVMDLRGESHGLIDGNVFMSWIENNFVNEGKTTEEVLDDEAAQLSELRAQGTVEMYQTDDNWCADKEAPLLTFNNPEILSEEDLVTNAGASYVRFATTNHFRPDDGTVDDFVDFMATVPEDVWLLMHCYAGEGRTTCFMCMCDIYKNYKAASFDDIAARQGLIGPVDVRTEAYTTGKSHYKKKASVERRVFLQQFYRYATETDFSSPWTDWARKMGITLEYYVE